MSNRYIIDYLRQNKDKFPIEALKKKLLEAGYPEKEIDEAIKIVQEPVSKFQKTERATNFWDFTHKKIYHSGKEKLLDFIAGILFLIISAVIFEIIPFGLFFSPILFLAAIIYFFIIKRGYIPWGIILGLPVYLVIFVLGHYFFH